MFDEKQINREKNIYLVTYDVLYCEAFTKINSYFYSLEVYCCIAFLSF